VRWIVLAAILCSCTEGPTALSFDRESRAGYAWSGPGSFCCDVSGTENVGWQIWFTNTSSCPTTGTQAVALLMILTSKQVPPDSGEFPVLPSLEIPIHQPFPPIAEPMAYLNTDDFEAHDGRLSLDTFSPDLVAGTLHATGESLSGTIKGVAFDGEFSAPYCEVIARVNGSL
jgi:hypothetical protein